MKLAIPDLVARLGPIVQDRQLYLAERLPDLGSGGFDVDLVNGVLALQPSGKKLAIQAIGSESKGTWMWAWANPSLAPRMIHLATSVRAWGQERGLDDLAKPGFPLDDVPGTPYTGFAVAAVAGGLTGAPGIYCCNDRARSMKLYVALIDQDLREPERPPLLRIALRYPMILALASQPADQGGIPIRDWAVGLVSYAKELGVACEPEGDPPEKFVLSHGDDKLVAQFIDGNLSLDLTGVTR